MRALGSETSKYRKRRQSLSVEDARYRSSEDREQVLCIIPHWRAASCTWKTCTPAYRVGTWSHASASGSTCRKGHFRRRARGGWPGFEADVWASALSGCIETASTVSCDCTRTSIPRIDYYPHEVNSRATHTHTQGKEVAESLDVHTIWFLYKLAVIISERSLKAGVISRHMCSFRFLAIYVTNNG